MLRVRLIHWKPADSAPLLTALRRTGCVVEFDETANAAATGRALTANPPDVVAIDTTRLPGQGRQFARWLGERKSTRHIPVVFLDARAAELKAVALARTLERSIQNWVPPERTQLVSSKTPAEKLGVKPGSTLGVIDPPRDYASVIGSLPAGAEFSEDQAGSVTVWFIEDEQSLFTRLAAMASLAQRTRLWFAWRKGQKSGFNSNAVRGAALDAGLVDYKVCSLDSRWSAIALARRKPA